MKILVTGAAGFIGQLIVEALLEDESHTLILADIAKPSPPQNAKHPERATSLAVDLCDNATSVVPKDLDAAILLHGIMSSGAEADLELGYRVNVDATRSLLDSLRKRCPGVKVIYTSSEAVYGRPVPKENVSEADIATPEMSYGCQKLICETIVNDYTRRGFIDGISLRLPTISIRPGNPSSAITSFLSGVIREPLNGQPCTIPLRDRAWRHWMCSPKTLIFNILVALQLPRDALPPHRRAVNAPGFAVTIQEMLDALSKVGGEEILDLVKEEEAPELKSVLYSWADNFDNSLALSLGMRKDCSFLDSVQDYHATLADGHKHSTNKK